MIAPQARLGSTRQIFNYLRISVMIGVLTAYGSVAAGADMAQEAFGHLSLNEKWHGDFHDMAERRLVRVLVVPDSVGFYIDQGHYRGVNADLLKAFEKFINRENKRQVLKIDVIFLPVYPDQLIPALLEGIGDIAVGNLTISAERLKKVDFSTPFLTDVRKIVVTNSRNQPLSSIDDLSDQNVHIRKSSSSYDHVLGINEIFKNRGVKPIKIIEADEHFEDADLLQMVNSGLIQATVVDDHIAKFWRKTYKDITLNQDITFHEGGDIGWAFRRNSPKLAEVVNRFVDTTKIGTELGNVVFKKYLHDDKRVRKALSIESFDRYQSVVELFKKYAELYQFDYLMTKAIAYQESELNHDKLSPCGAVGIMQLLPQTAADKNVGIPNIYNLEDNVHAGHKYLRFIQDRYFSVPEIDYLNRYLFTFAAYNAGPAKILQLRSEAKKRELDPNVWFKNVEVIAAEKIGRETVQYVSRVYRNYIAYKLSNEKTDTVKTRPISLAEITPDSSHPTELQERKRPSSPPTIQAGVRR